MWIAHSQGTSHAQAYASTGSLSAFEHYHHWWSTVFLKSWDVTNHHQLHSNANERTERTNTHKRTEHKTREREREREETNLSNNTAAMAIQTPIQLRRKVSAPLSSSSSSRANKSNSNTAAKPRSLLSSFPPVASSTTATKLLKKLSLLGGHHNHNQDGGNGGRGQEQLGCKPLPLVPRRDGNEIAILACGSLWESQHALQRVSSSN